MSVIVIHKDSLTMINLINVTEISRTANIISITGAVPTQPSVSSIHNFTNADYLVRILEN